MKKLRLVLILFNALLVLFFMVSIEYYGLDESFDRCCRAILLTGFTFGMTYEECNIALFVIIMPLIILIETIFSYIRQEWTDVFNDTGLSIFTILMTMLTYNYFTI